MNDLTKANSFSNFLLQVVLPIMILTNAFSWIQEDIDEVETTNDKHVEVSIKHI